MAAFQYTSLDRSTSSIRLFSLLSSSSDSNVYGNLDTFELASAPSYIALSYTWGDPTQTRNIWVNGQPLLVRENLYLALETLSRQIVIPYSSVIVYFWIDFICINQGNVHERSHQVGLMSQIFTGASRTIAWLGPPADDSSYAMTLMDGIGNMDFEPLDKFKCDQERFVKAILHLFERPYWRRMWIVQEFILPQELTLLCGLDAISGDKMLQVLQTIRYLGLNGHTAHTAPTLDLITLCVTRKMWHLGDTKQFTLVALMRQFCRADCSDVRDRVFALLSLMRTKPSENFMVSDYTLSPLQLYYRTLSGMIMSLRLNDVQEWEAFRFVLARALRIGGHICNETVVYGACVAIKMRQSLSFDDKATWATHVLNKLITLHRYMCDYGYKTLSRSFLSHRVREQYPDLHIFAAEEPLHRHRRQSYQQVSTHCNKFIDFHSRVVNLHIDVMQEQVLDMHMIQDFSDSVWQALKIAIDTSRDEKIKQLQEAVDEEEWWLAYLAKFPWTEVGSSDRQAFLRKTLDRSESVGNQTAELMLEENGDRYLGQLLKSARALLAEIEIWASLEIVHQASCRSFDARHDSMADMRRLTREIEIAWNSISNLFTETDIVWNST